MASTRSARPTVPTSNCIKRAAFTELTFSGQFRSSNVVITALRGGQSRAWSCLFFPILSAIRSGDRAGEFDKVRINDSERLQAFTGAEQVFAIVAPFPE